MSALRGRYPPLDGEGLVALTELLQNLSQSDRIAPALVVGANARAHSFADGSQEWSGQVRRLFGETFEGRGGDFDDEAVGVCDDISGAGAVIEEGNIAKKFSWAQNREDCFFVANKDAHA